MGEHDHPLFAAIYDPVTAVIERTLLAPHREYLARDLDGVVLDLGCGTGAMFPYFDPGATVYAVEPDDYMRRRATEYAAEIGFDVDLRGVSATDLPYADDSFDAVVAAMVFCTIGDPDAALSELSRVLRPGGEVRFLEHVVDDGWRERVQELVAPIWRRLAGGCRLTRRTAAQFGAHPDFDVVELDRFALGVTPVRPFVRGRLRRRR